MGYLISIVLVALSINVNAADVMVMDAYVRATPPGAMNSAAFMTLHNHSASEKALVSAETTAAKVVELHNHVNENGVMKMRQVAGGIKLPAHGMVTLQPGGLHVMLMGLVQDLKEGNAITLTLHFDDGSSQGLTVPVKNTVKPMQMHHH